MIGIFMPRAIEIFTSKDGNSFQKIALLNPEPTKSTTPPRFNFLKAEIPKNKNHNFVKILLQNIPAIPDWHPGKGTPAWIFLDEILIQ